MLKKVRCTRTDPKVTISRLEWKIVKTLLIQCISRPYVCINNVYSIAKNWDSTCENFVDTMYQ